NQIADFIIRTSKKGGKINIFNSLFTFKSTFLALSSSSSSLPFNFTFRQYFVVVTNSSRDICLCFRFSRCNEALNIKCENSHERKSLVSFTLKPDNLKRFITSLPRCVCSVPKVPMTTVFINPPFKTPFSSNPPPATGKPQTILLMGRLETNVWGSSQKLLKISNVALPILLAKKLTALSN